jgi:glycosyltransferase involved in cell wall biosynthesis
LAISRTRRSTSGEALVAVRGARLDARGQGGEFALKARINGVTTPMEILPTGIPLARFSKGDGSAFRQRHGISASRPLALFVGRVAHEKNIGFLIDALKVASAGRPDLLLLITGEGPASGDLRRHAEAAGLADKVRFLGYLDRQRDLPDCYAAADIFAFASRTETQGLVLLEAMAAGVPVIALSAMGTADILGAGRGCIVPPDEVAAFGTMLAHFFNHRDTAWKHLAAEARAGARAWSDAAMAERLATHYRSLRRQHLERQGFPAAAGA